MNNKYYQKIQTIKKALAKEIDSKTKYPKAEKVFATISNPLPSW